MTVANYTGLNTDPSLSLYHLYDPDILAYPYPLYHRLQDEDPVHWDPFLNAWVVTKYSDVLFVLQNFSAKCAPCPERLIQMGADSIKPIADVMVLQMLFMDPPDHTRLRGVCAGMFKPRLLERLREHIQDIVNDLLRPRLAAGSMDILGDFANRLPAIVTAELMGVPPEDHEQLKLWSADFAEILGNFQHNPDRDAKMLKSLQEMIAYFRNALEEHRARPRQDVITALLNAGIYGVHLDDAVIIANCILVMVGGQETTPNLIGNGMLSLLKNPGELEKLRSEPPLIPTAMEELLRYEAPSQHTTRLAPHDVELRGRRIGKEQSVIAVMGSANRDPEQFSQPDRLDITRSGNKHLAFGGGPHFCFGAPLARLEAHIAFETLLRCAPEMALAPIPLQWRPNLGLRGLTALPVSFAATAPNHSLGPGIENSANAAKWSGIQSIA
ncbi:MAG: cytochrome [Acidobacteriaceae bacterium]|nr:cytochrome [Acidobacteriaceae bacterium]